MLLSRLLSSKANLRIVQDQKEQKWLGRAPDVRPIYLRLQDEHGRSDEVSLSPSVGIRIGPTVQLGLETGTLQSETDEGKIDLVCFFPQLDKQNGFPEPEMDELEQSFKKDMEDS